MEDLMDGLLAGLGDVVDDNAEFIPLLSPEDEEKLKNEDLPQVVDILPLRNTVLFPGVVIPITVGRDKSIELVRKSYAGKKSIGVVSQKDQEEEDPKIENLNKIGTLAKILKLLKMPDGSTMIIIQGKQRFKIKEIVSYKPFISANIEKFDLKEERINDSNRFEALVASIKDMALKIIKLSPNIPTEAKMAIKNIESPSFMMNFISSNMNASVQEKQALLEIVDMEKKALSLLKYLSKELQMLEIKKDIQSKVKTDIDQQQREFFLHQQMKTIQEELGGSPHDQDLEDFKKRAGAKKWSKKVKKAFEKELDKLVRMNPAGAEYGVQLNYLDVLLDLPWNQYSNDKFDIKRAQRILNRDHYGLEKVKERILEHLAVLKLRGDMKSPILCLYGPPGVGKTSLGKSIAEALGRKYVRMSLGGLRDEAEIRGHRRTYIGAMPGRILQNLKKVKTSNPVFVLDELDKMGSDYHGDPSSAMLEVLDPEQNNAFHDNFVELDFDLSKVMFVATANSLNTIQPALRDRLEIIEVNGYTVEEKIQIAKNHLIPKQVQDHGLTSSDIKLTTKTIEKVITEYTRESGVRGLEKKISKLVRAIAKNIAMEESYEKTILPEHLIKHLGPGMAMDKYQNMKVPGVCIGLAWTSVGGDILFIETSLTKGKGRLTLTGNLGDVMKESASIALEFLKAHSDMIGLEQEVFDKWNVHIHVPEGATPKDGPSAGITMLTALASAFSQRKVKNKLAMTGEITLRGDVLPVGGIKEKILAAKRASVSEIILCQENEKDVDEINPNYIKGLTFHYVKRMEEVLEIALTKNKVPQAIKIE